MVFSFSWTGQIKVTVTVGPFGEGGAHKVHAGGPGLERGEINVPGKAVCCCLFRLVSSNCDGSPGFKIFKYI